MTNSSSTPEAAGFSDLGLLPELLGIVRSAGLHTPTPIQAEAIPVALTGVDVMGIAQTGTGKTLAFALPMLQYILQHRGARGLVVLPTRELALQVDETVQKLGRTLGIRSVVLIGGAPMFNQTKQLRTNPQIIVATPGRLNDHLGQGTVQLDKVAVAVFDEADRMLDMGFAPQINRIMETVPKQRQTMLFSATMPAEIVAIAEQYMRQPIRVEIARAGTVTEQVQHELCIVTKERKRNLLEQLLAQYSGTVLVFSRTKHGAKKLTEQLRVSGHSAAEIHANRSLAQRRQALDGFKSGRYRVLVATDIAARGIDVTGIELVVNFDLPDAPEDYVHRIGRTGRAGKTGRAISFATPDQAKDVRDIERLLQGVLPISEHSEAQLDAAASGARPQRGRGGRSSSYSSSGDGARQSQGQPAGNRSGDGRQGYGRGGQQDGQGGQGGAPRREGGSSSGGRRQGGRRSAPPPKAPFPEVSQTATGYFMRRAR